MYLVGALILYYLLLWSVDWIWGFFTTAAPSDTTVSLIAGGAVAVLGILAYRNDRLYHLANEVASELKKVTWPAAKEVRSATTVVIIMSLISAVVLFAFDFMWSGLTDMVYGG
jgi:preprotein translocase subunit SecE